GFGEMDQHEICRARSYNKAERADLLGQPSEPTRVMRAREFHMRGVADGGNTCSNRRAIDVEWSANTIYRVYNVRGPVHPAKAQRRQPIDLRKGARHYDVVGGGDQFDS